MEYIGVAIGGTFTDENKDCYGLTFMSAYNYYKEDRKLEFLENIINDYVGKNISIHIVEQAIYAHYDNNIESLKERFIERETTGYGVHNLNGVISIKREFYRTQKEKDVDYINVYIGETNLTRFIIDHAIDRCTNSKQFLRIRIKNN